MEKSKKNVTNAGSARVAAGFQFSPMQKQALGWAFPALAVIAGLLYALPMPGMAGAMGFPFDDAYSVLTFARNLAENGVYSSHIAEGATSGVTAPLQVFLISAIGILTGGLRASLLLGIAGYAAVAGLTFAVGLRLFRDRQWLAAAAALLVVLSSRMAGASVSGLPTLLFTALVLASAYFYFARRSMLFFLFAGLALWTHPAALVFMLAALIHLLYNHLLVKSEFKPAPVTGQAVTGQAVTGRETGIGAVIFLLLLAGYGLFNFLLSGNFFVNPVSAKLAYYAGAGTGFVDEAWRFFTREGWGALVLFAGLALVLALVDAVRRRSLPVLMAAAFVPGMLLSYGLLHPVILDHHTLLPALPFFALLGVWGLSRLFSLVAGALPLSFMPRLSAGIVAVVLAVAAVLSVTDWDAYRQAHYRSVRYVLDRNVAAGKWIAENTPLNVRVATPLPGAITYYGDRAVLDVTGKLSPGLIETMGSMAELVAALRKAGVHIVAARRDQLEVVNTNPVFSSDPRLPDVMEVFFYAPGRTHLMSQSASALNVQASRLMSLRRWSDAMSVLQRSFKEDPYSCRTSTLYGLTLLQLGDTANARAYLSQALTLHAEYAPAMVPLADIMVRQKEFDQAIRMLEQALEVNPSSVQAEASLREAREAKRRDSLAASGIHTFTFTR
jgi:hypothetical protein